MLAPDGNGSFGCEGGGRDGDVLTAYVASPTGVHTLLVHSRSGSGQGEARELVP